tara:strand:- start:9929 stop:10072 length:144 start_codon:yes stop_codon:yes gene_type:complete
MESLKIKMEGEHEKSKHRTERKQKPHKKGVAGKEDVEYTRKIIHGLG